MMKSSVEEIRKHFDNDVERFANEETGQTAAMDSLLVLQMIADSIALRHPDAAMLCDIGCGGGNFTVKILRRLPHIRCTLIDLSRPMLDRAQERVRSLGGTPAEAVQGDIRTLTLNKGVYDVITAGAVLHHLRSREEWSFVLRKIYDALIPGGSFWYWDLVRHEDTALEKVQQDRYAQYLIGCKDEAYQKQVFGQIEKEDTPESSVFILEAFRNAGFRNVDIIHKNGPFAALLGMK
jgi:tRNA (cmo5U34)-methyltransferase